jgi:hypothetical protein
MRYDEGKNFPHLIAAQSDAGNRLAKAANAPGYLPWDMVIDRDGVDKNIECMAGPNKHDGPILDTLGLLCCRTSQERFCPRNVRGLPEVQRSP